MFALGVMCYTLAVGQYPFAPEVVSGPGGLPTFQPSVELFPPNEVGSGRCTRLALQLQKACSSNLARVSAECLDLMEQLLAPNPELRPSAEEALAHPWITGALSVLGLFDEMTDIG